LVQGGNASGRKWALAYYIDHLFNEIPIKQGGYQNPELVPEDREKKNHFNFLVENNHSNGLGIEKRI